MRSGDGIVPASYIEEMSTKEFFELFAELVKANPIKDAKIAAIFEEFGLSENGFDTLTEEVKKALEEGRTTGFSEIRFGKRMDKYTYQTNNWSVVTGGVGTYGTDYLKRASTAFGGWGANIVEDSVYAVTAKDNTGEVFSNQEEYVLHFDADGYPHAAVF